MTPGKVSRASKRSKKGNGGGSVVQRAMVSGTRLPPGRSITHREMVGSLTSAATANWQSLGISANTPGYDINPANSLLFPWLSTQALSWEKYRFSKLVFELIPGNPSTVPGRIYGVIDYDYDDEVPTSMDTMAGFYGLLTSDVWQPLRIVTDCGRMNQGLPWRFVSQSDRVNGIEPRTAFGGYLFLAAQGTTTACTWDLFVEYTIELSVPQTAQVGATSTLVPSVVPLNAVPPGSYYPLSISTAGSLATAVSGMPGIPVLALSSGASWAGMGVIDATKYRRGKIELDTVIANCVGTPAANVVQCSLEAFAFNPTGTYLGFLSGACPTGFPFAARVPGEWATAGANLATTWYLLMANIFAAYPTTKFITFAVFNQLAKAGEVANSITGNIRASTLEP